MTSAIVTVAVLPLASVYGASTPPQGQYNWQSVIMHEVGHSMGFFDTVAQNGSYSNAGPGIFETLSTLGVGGLVLSSRHRNMTHLSTSARSFLHSSLR